MKFDYILKHENSWNKFDIDHGRNKVKVTVDLQKFSPYTEQQTVRYNISIL